MQAKLLRVLQNGEYTPIGGMKSKSADTLIVAATNKDCQEEIKYKRLREDFYYRIGVIEIPLPPLRERIEDLPFLIEHLLDQYRQKQETLHGNTSAEIPKNQTALPGELVQALYSYQWPGNVRELQNILQRYLATRHLSSTLSLVSLSHLPLPESKDSMNKKGRTLPEVIEEVEKQMITDALIRNNFRIGKTAELLGLPVRTLQRRIKQYQIAKFDQYIT
jgi:transcriptional regulator with PAS, ATPase and Fis domain